MQDSITSASKTSKEESREKKECTIQHHERLHYPSTTES